MNKIKEILKNDRVERALKTFIETFCSYIAINIMCTDLTSKSALYGLLAGAVGSAISIILNPKKKESE